jgi:hypothetical protein
MLRAPGAAAAAAAGRAWAMAAPAEVLVLRVLLAGQVHWDPGAARLQRAFVTATSGIFPAGVGWCEGVGWMGSQARLLPQSAGAVGVGHTCSTAAMLCVMRCGHQCVTGRSSYAAVVRHCLCIRQQMCCCRISRCTVSAGQHALVSSCVAIAPLHVAMR